VQNHYNVVHRVKDSTIAALAAISIVILVKVFYMLKTLLTGLVCPAVIYGPLVRKQVRQFLGDFLYELDGPKPVMVSPRGHRLSPCHRFQTPDGSSHDIVAKRVVIAKNLDPCGYENGRDELVGVNAYFPLLEPPRLREPPRLTTARRRVGRLVLFGYGRC